MEGHALIRSSVLVPVSDKSGVSEARRAANLCAESLGLTEVAAGRVALVTTELATNLLKHAPGGAMLFGSDDERSRSITIIAIDKGRGIANLPTALRDGYSTAGSPGTGLGAVARSASTFDVYSMNGNGTAVMCRVSDESGKESGRRPHRVTVGGICIAMPGEEEPGDAWTVTWSADGPTITVADGLGHGPAAATAAIGAIRAVRERPDASLESLLQDAHGALRASRGAAVAMARVHAAAGNVEFAGVGNIAATIVSDDAARKTVSLPGIVGHEMRRVQIYTYPWVAGSVMVMHSDGLSASWNADKYPGLLQRDPSLIAAVLYRDFNRAKDDATVVVAKAS